LSAKRQPDHFPNRTQFSVPLLVAHSAAYQMWSEGKTASAGIKTFAEVRMYVLRMFAKI